ncbi:MAG: hypothetical protein A4E35_00098 [Methanoregula sp. PtaU1.Bin051]|nr:MAG: hypothetical protein A4E35_00098 [Methanoregula sp. PtaU1.Bin051]
MIGNVPIAKPVRKFVAHAEELLGTEIVIARDREAPLSGTLVDRYTYPVENEYIVFPAHYVGLIKDFIIAKLTLTLLIKGAAAKRGEYKVISFTEESVYNGMRQIYLDALKDEAKKEKKLPVNKLIEMLFILYMHFQEDMNELPWNPVVNTGVYIKIPKIRKTQLYYLMKEGKEDMDEMMEQMDIIPRRYFVFSKAMFYARDYFLARTLPADELMPVINIPQMKKFNHLEVKEMLTTRWTHTAWYQSKVFGDSMIQIMDSSIINDWNANPDLDYYYNLYMIIQRLTDNLLSYMSMNSWFVWEPVKHLQDAMLVKGEYEQKALRRIFGDLIL